VQPYSTITVCHRKVILQCVFAILGAGHIRGSTVTMAMVLLWRRHRSPIIAIGTPPKPIPQRYRFTLRYRAGLKVSLRDCVIMAISRN
jgi:hypothetical protein